MAAAQKQIESDANCSAQLTSVWDQYLHPGGAVQFIVARFDLEDGSKQFRPFRPHKGGWRIGDPSEPLVLYRANDLPADGTIYVTEGEKAADAAVALGLQATTSAHGASSADATDWRRLAGHDGTIVFLPDNDNPGAAYARSAARIIFDINPGAQIKIVQLMGLPEGGDIVEFVEAGGTREDVEMLAHGARPITASEMIGGPVLVSMADIQPVSIQWLWQGRIPLGRISFLAGRPGEGKSFLTCDLASRVSTGSPLPDGTPCPKGSVLLISGEDDGGDTIRPRLDASYADVNKIHLLTMVKRPGEKGMIETLFTLADVAAMEAALRQLPDCKLIIIDPIGSFLGGTVDAHRDNEVRAVLAPVGALAAKYGAAVLIVAHVRKAASAAADDTVLGSRAFTGIARAVWHLSRDKMDRDRRLLLPGKCNLSKQPDGMAFTIGGTPPCLTWERDPVKLHADDVMEQNNQPGPEPEARRAAEEWLSGVLVNGAVPSGDVKDPAEGSIRAQAKEADFKWATVRRAADKLGVRRERDQFTKAFTWRLPKGGNSACSSMLLTLSKKAQHEQHEQQENDSEIPSILTNQNHVAQEDSVLACACAREDEEIDITNVGIEEGVL